MTTTAAVNSVLVGMKEPEVSAALQLAHSIDASEPVQHNFGRQRLVFEFPLSSSAEADRAARQFRLHGFAAIAGPTSPGHQLAWANRNAPAFFGERACVCFPWSVFEDSAVDLLVEIDPGSGFGAGGHPSTALLLHDLRSMDLRDSTVLDVGCGTGVLGITAALLGARRVVATDISPSAVEATARNARRNGVGAALKIGRADLREIDECFDVVLANIHAEVLVRLSADLRRVTALDGELGLSGLSPSQPSVVAAALDPMLILRRDRRDDWVSLWFGHRRSGPGTASRSVDQSG